MQFLGVDIGGANLKLATVAEYATTIPFALWRAPQELGANLTKAIADAPAHNAIAATTTGELADCFTTKREGILAIYSALATAAGECPVFVYLTDGRFVSINEAIASPELAAASNWHALARFAGRFTPTGESLLIDIGSTTADLVPLSSGRPSCRGRTDTERLLHGELVYTGVTRTAVASLVQTLPWRGRECPIARELFATSLDAHLILENLPVDSLDTNTADGRPAMRWAARDRLARMIGADRDTFDDDDALRAAKSIAAAQRRLIGDALQRLLERGAERPKNFLLSGQGEFLARQVLDELQVAGLRISLSERLGASVSQAAAAYALAVLAQESIDAEPADTTVTVALS